MHLNLPRIGQRGWGLLVLDAIDTLETDTAAALAAAQVGGFLSGTGSPEGVETATVGKIYYDTAATTGAVLWVKASGSGNTGWEVLYGDTGWRSVNSWVVDPADLSTGTRDLGDLYVRRVNETVYLRAERLSATTNLCIKPAAGFYAARAAIISNSWDATSTKRLGPTAGFAGVYYHLGSGPWIIGAAEEATFTSADPTDDAWPATLPGTAA